MIFEPVPNSKNWLTWADFYLDGDGVLYKIFRQITWWKKYLPCIEWLKNVGIERSFPMMCLLLFIITSVIMGMAEWALARTSDGYWTEKKLASTGMICQVGIVRTRPWCSEGFLSIGWGCMASRGSIGPDGWRLGRHLNVNPSRQRRLVSANYISMALRWPAKIWSWVCGRNCFVGKELTSVGNQSRLFT